MSSQNIRLIALCTAAAATFALASTAQGVDLRSWDQKFSDASKRFIVLGSFNNKAVLDKETQLVWERTPSSQIAPQTAAPKLCANSTTGGQRGWRLPAFHEMASLVDPFAPYNKLALPAGHPFTNVRIGAYWTATRSGHSSTDGYLVLLHEAGTVKPWVESYSAYRWCVRGGGPVSDF